MSAGRFVYLEDCAVVRETDKAVLIRYRGENVWLPRACLENDGDDLKTGQAGYTVAVSRRMAVEKGLDFEDT